MGAPDGPPASGVAMGVRFVGARLDAVFEDPDEGLPVTHVDSVDRAVVDREWASAQSAELLHERTVDGRPFLSVEHDPDRGWRVQATDHGVHVVSADGRRVVGFFGARRPWTARRLVVAQVMPLVSLLRGREVLHAGAVRLGAATVAVAAPSGTGKTSTLTQLVAQGADFVADDHLAIEARADDGEVHFYAGPRLINIGAAELQKVGGEGRGRAALGAEIGRSDKIHLEPPPPRVLSGRLTHLLALDRSRPFQVTRVVPSEDIVAQLLGASYAPYVAPDQRLLRQLDLAQLARRTVSFARVEVGERDDAAAVASAVRGWLESEG